MTRGRESGRPVGAKTGPVHRTAAGRSSGVDPLATAGARRDRRPAALLGLGPHGLHAAARCSTRPRRRWVGTRPSRTASAGRRSMSCGGRAVMTRRPGSRGGRIAAPQRRGARDWLRVHPEGSAPAWAAATVLLLAGRVDSARQSHRRDARRNARGPAQAPRTRAGRRRSRGSAHRHHGRGRRHPRGPRAATRGRRRSPGLPRGARRGGPGSRWPSRAAGRPRVASAACRPICSGGCGCDRFRYAAGLFAVGAWLLVDGSRRAGDLGRSRLVLNGTRRRNQPARAQR